MRLVDTIASCRRLYSRPVPTLPDILLLDVPARFADATLPLGRYYPILLETEVEQVELAAYLDADRQDLVAPTLFDRRPSALLTSRIMLARYAPDQPSWPEILLCHWPVDLVALAPNPQASFVRQAYTIEIFPDERQLRGFARTMLATLAQSGAGPVTLITPDSTGGSA